MRLDRTRHDWTRTRVIAAKINRQIATKTGWRGGDMAEDRV